MAGKSSIFVDNSPPAVDATWLNIEQTEQQNEIESSGQTLSDIILDQRAIAMASYAAQGGVFCTDSGAADAYVVDQVSPFKAPYSYTNGLLLRFRPGNANTGGACTVAPFGFAPKSVKMADGTTNPPAGTLNTSQDIEMRYNGTVFVLTGASTFAQATETQAGIAEIATQAEISNGTDAERIVTPEGLAFKQQQIALLTYQVASGTNGGGSTSGSWLTRPLNTEVLDPANIVTLSANQFTLNAGTYKISSSQTLAADTQSNYLNSKGRIRNITGGTTISGGISLNISQGTTDLEVQRDSNIVTTPETLVTITSAKTFELQYFTNIAYPTSGLGRAANSGEVEVYAYVQIEKI